MNSVSFPAAIMIAMWMLWLIPIVSAVWAVVLLHRIHGTQRSIAATLKAIEQRPMK